MLLSLNLENLVLIAKAHVRFGEGFNILTGETGSGKSILLTAIRLMMGERASSELIRDGASCAIVEAELSSFSSDLELGIDLPRPGEPLSIRRELHRSGKSRCFVQDQLVPANVLRNLTRSAIEIIDQSSSQMLCSSDAQRKMLDAFADLASVTALFARSYSEEIKAKKHLKAALEASATYARDLEWAESNLRIIEETGLQQGEEERLNEQHSLLTHAQELIEKAGAVAEGLAAGAPQIKRLSHLLDAVLKVDPRLISIGQSLKSAGIELEEAEASLRSYLEQCDADPRRLAAIENRIAAIEQLKRRCGPTWEDIEKQKVHFVQQIERLGSLESEIDSLKEHLIGIEQENRTVANRISETRKAAAVIFAKRVSAELKSLNLPYAQFEVSITPYPKDDASSRTLGPYPKDDASSGTPGQLYMSPHGIDAIRFLFSANPGLAAIPLESCASGGELSRLLLAIKTVLAEKEGCACLVFDEIDSNVGGQTAAILGEKLKKLSEKRQMICVTHFVQVARSAMHHFSVLKEECEGRAVISVQQLQSSDREKEYNRMQGGEPRP